MTTRRQFVKTVALVPFAGVTASLPWSTRLDCSASECQSEEPVYAGKPLSYWLAKVTSRDYDRDVCDVAEQWIFRHFGDVAIPGLIEAMRSNSWFHAETELEMIGTPTTVRALTQALTDGDPRVRHGAVSAMYRIGLFKVRKRPELVPAFREALPILAEVLRTDPEDQVATIAAWILFEHSLRLNSEFSLPVKVSEYASAATWAQVVRRYAKHFSVEHAVPVLVSLLSNDDVTTRLKAAQALSRFDPDHPGIVPVFMEHVIGREHITGLEFHGLDRIVEKALPALRKEYRSGNAKARVSILHALACCQSSIALPILAEGLVDEARTVRARAVLVFLSINTPEAVPLLIRALQDREQCVRKNARWMLESNEHLTTEAMPELLELLEDGNSIGRTSAALILIDLNRETDRAVLELISSLGHNDVSVRVEAAIAITKIDPDRRELADVLAEGIESEDYDLRRRAIDALGRMGQSSATVLPRIVSGLSRHHHSEGQLLRMLMELGAAAASAVPGLIEWMKDREVGRDVPMVLGRIGREAIPSLTACLQSDDLLVQSRAVRTLGHLGESAREFVPMLVGFLNSGLPVLQIAAAEALGGFGSSAAEGVPALTRAARDHDIGVRVHAKQAISRIKGESVA